MDGDAKPETGKTADGRVLRPIKSSVLNAELEVPVRQIRGGVKQVL